jgi:hypothetical protein
VLSHCESRRVLARTIVFMNKYLSNSQGLILEHSHHCLSVDMDCLTVSTRILPQAADGAAVIVRTATPNVKGRRAPFVASGAGNGTSFRKPFARPLSANMERLAKPKQTSFLKAWGPDGSRGPVWTPSGKVTPPLPMLPFATVEHCGRSVRVVDNASHSSSSRCSHRRLAITHFVHRVSSCVRKVAKKRGVIFSRLCRHFWAPKTRISTTVATNPDDHPEGLKANRGGTLLRRPRESEAAYPQPASSRFLSCILVTATLPTLRAEQLLRHRGKRFTLTRLVPHGTITTREFSPT